MKDASDLDFTTEEHVNKATFIEKDTPKVYAVYFLSNQPILTVGFVV